MWEDGIGGCKTLLLHRSLIEFILLLLWEVYNKQPVCVYIEKESDFVLLIMVLKESS